MEQLADRNPDDAEARIFYALAFDQTALPTDKTYASLGDALAQAKEDYWAEQVEIQRKGAEAWALWAEGKKAEALAADKPERPELAEARTFVRRPGAP